MFETRDHDDVKAFLDRMAGEAAASPAVRPAVRRARRRLTLTAVAGVAALVLAGYVAVGTVDVARDWNQRVPGSDVSPSVAPPTSSFDRGSASNELSHYVLPTFDGAEAKGFDKYSGGGIWSAEDISGTFDLRVSDLEEAGFVDAYGTAWFKETWGAPNAQDLISVAMLFEDEAGARRAYELLRATLRDDPIEWLPDPGFGRASHAFKGRLGANPTVAFAWWTGDLLVVVASQGGSGTEALSPGLMADLAARVDALIDAKYPLLHG